MHSKDGTTIPGTVSEHQAKTDAAKDTALGPRPDAEENTQGSGLEPDGEDNGDADVGMPRP